MSLLVCYISEVTISRIVLLHCCITYPNLLRSILMLGVLCLLFYVTTSNKLTHFGKFALFVRHDAYMRRLVL